MQEFILFLSNHILLVVLTFIVTILVLIVELIRTRRRGFYLDPQETVQKINHENAVVIDLRPAENYRKGHIIGALNIPVIELREHPEKLEKFKEKPVIFVCDTGVSSRQLAMLFYQKYYNSYSLKNGINSWMQANLSFIKEK